jgi:hypothetical protein
MGGNVIEHDDSENGATIKIGDSGSRLPIKVYQDLYHQITGRTERITKVYWENLLIELSEIEQLNFKIEQLCDVHHVVAKNITITVFYERDRKEVFTSFERFLTYNANTPSPTLNILLKYNFSIIPGGLERPQEYVVSIRLSSRIAIGRQLREEAPPYVRVPSFFRFASISAAEASIDYVDYVIARGFREAVDEWVKGCKATHPMRGLRYLQRYSYLIPNVIKILCVGIITWFALKEISTFPADTGSALWARFFLIYASGSFILIMLAGYVGELIEEAIDTYPVLSYLKLNRGDNNLIEEFNSSKKKAFYRSVFAGAITVLLGIISSKLALLV